MASAGTGYKLSLGADGPPGSYDDFDHADVFFVIGANMADCHPILFLRMMDRVKAGAKLIVVDPRRTATADKADLFLQIDPGTDLALLNGLLHLLVADGHIDEEFIAEHTEGWDGDARRSSRTTRRTRSPRSPASPRRTSATAARLIGEAGELDDLLDDGAQPEHPRHLEHQRLVNLHLATGAICRPGSGPFSLTGQPNAMGGREMGYMGPGPARPALGARRRGPRVRRGRRGGCAPGTLRTEVGTGTVEMFEQMADGEIKACWIICTNPVASVANRETVIDGLEAAELVITQDVFAETETNAYADVVLPAALWAESDGVMVNSERNLTLLQPAVDPPGEALPDWQLIAEVACAMGFADALRLRQRRGGLRRDQAVLRTRRPATTCAASPTSGCARARAVAGAARDATGAQPDPLPQRRRQPDAARRRRTARRPRLAFPTAERPGACSSPRPHLPRRRDARRRLPVRAQHRPAAAPVAHADQDRQGRQAEQAQPRTVRRDAPRRRRTRSASPTATRSRSPRAAAGPCCRRSSPTGCGRATASRRSTGTTCSAST